MFEVGALTKINHGVTILGRGASRISAFGIPINLEASNASEHVIRVIEKTGGSIDVNYRTPLIMRNYLKPHRFGPHQQDLKTPMPPPKVIKKLEKLREKGLNVNYPRAPWFTDNVETIKKER